MITREAIARDMGSDWAEAWEYWRGKVGSIFPDYADQILTEALGDCWSKFDAARGASPKTALYWFVRKSIKRLKDSRLFTGWGNRDVRVVSLDAPMGDDDVEGASGHDVVCDLTESLPADRVANNEQARVLRSLVDTLPGREKTILTLRFGLDGQGEHTLHDVARVLGCSHERVRQLEKTIKLKLRTRLEAVR